MQASVTARDIQLVLNDFVDEIPPTPYTSIKTRSGATIDADLVVCPCLPDDFCKKLTLLKTQLLARGPKPNTQFIAASLGADSLSDAQFVKVTKTFQLPAHSDIFAIGDVTAIQVSRIPLARVHALTCV